MIETLLGITLFGSVIWSIIIITLFIIICFIAEGTENGWFASGSLIILTFIIYRFGNDNWYSLYKYINIYVILSYLGIGFIHAIIRVYFYGRYEALKRNKDILNGSKYPHVIDNNIKEHVFRWWFNWVISLMMWMIQDLFIDIWSLLYDKISNIFNKIMAVGVNSIENIKDDEIKNKY